MSDEGRETVIQRSDYFPGDRPDYDYWRNTDKAELEAVARSICHTATIVNQSPCWRDGRSRVLSADDTVEIMWPLYRWHAYKAIEALNAVRKKAGNS